MMTLRMRLHPLLLLLSAAILIATLAASTTASEATGNLRSLDPAGPGQVDLDTGRVIVDFAPGVSAAEQAAIHASLNARVVDTLDGLGFVIVEAPNPAATQALADAYSRLPGVNFAEPDALMPLADAAVVPNDLYFFLQWEHDAIDSPEAWATTTGSADTLITICDTGVSPTHPDLVTNLRGDLGLNTASGGSWGPIHWHGGAVAGSAAAAGNNSIGVSGVNWTAGIVPVRVTDRTDGDATISAIVACIEYGADIGSTAINVSYTSYTNGGVDPAILAAADYAEAAGSVLVIAAGNSNRDDAPGQDPEHILYVSATNSGDGKASFSNYGKSIDIAAPGESVVSTYSEVVCIGKNCGIGIEDYAFVSGTSFSAPIAAGAVALTASAHQAALDAMAPADRPAYLRGLITDGACDLGTPGEDQYFGAGLLNVHAAVHGTACDNPVPTPTIESVAISPLLATMYVDDTLQFTASAVWTDGSSTDVTNEVAWSIDNAAIATIDASGLATAHAAGNTNVRAILSTAEGDLSGVDPLLVEEPPVAGSTVGATSIEYTGSGGRYKDRNLDIAITVEDDLGQTIEGASVEIWLVNFSSGQIWTGTSTTDATGVAAFSLKNAPSGTYGTAVMDVTAAGYTWDGSTPPDDGWTKS